MKILCEPFCRSRSLVMILLGTVLLLGGCTMPKAPGELSWDMHLRVPFGTTTYGLANLAKTPAELEARGSGIGMSSDSVLYFAVFTDLVMPVGDSLRFEPFDGDGIKPGGISDSTFDLAMPAQRHRLIEGRIGQGQVSITLRNLSASAATISATLPALINSFGDTLVWSKTLGGGASADTTVNLFNYLVKLPDTSPQTFPVRLNAPQSTTAGMALDTSPLVFSYFRGTVQNLHLDPDEAGMAVEALPQGWDSLRPTEVSCYVHLRPGTIDANADIRLFARSLKNRTVFSTESINQDDIPLGADTTIVVHGLANMLAVYPDSMSASVNTFLNGPTTMNATDSLRITLEWRAPLRFIIRETHIPGETEEATSEDLKDIQKVSATFRIQNRLPLEATAFMVISNDSAALRPNSGAVVDTIPRGTIHLPVGTIIDGRPASSAQTSFTLELPESVIEIMKRPPFYTRLDLSIPSSNGDTLIAHAADWIRVQATADITYRVDTEEEDN